MPKSNLLLTSSGITNARINAALVDLLGKPIKEASAVYFPTAIYAYPHGGEAAWQGIKAAGNLGWKTFGVLDLTALPSVAEDVWHPQLETADAIMIGGGNKFYLSYWMEKSGLFDLVPHLIAQGKVYVGMSGGSMMASAGLNFDQEHLEATGVYHDDEFDESMPSSAGNGKTMRLVDFVIRPHLAADYFPKATLANMAIWAQKTAYPLYALDDQSALKVIDGKVEVVSEGQWKLFNG